jgi:hypothetical protein
LANPKSYPLPRIPSTISKKAADPISRTGGSGELLADVEIDPMTGGVSYFVRIVGEELACDRYSWPERLCKKN